MEIPISVLVLTHNEEADLSGCLDSVSWSDDVHVYDSFSTDETVKIARRAGAHVSQRKFDGYASQRNAALSQLKFKYPWVLILDADERIPEPLAEEISRVIANPPPGVVACRTRRRDYFMGTWLKHAAISQYFIRLVRPEKVRYEREINEVLKVDGLIHDLREPFDHYPFSKGLSHWFHKHNVYSSMEAKIALEARKGSAQVSWRKALFAKDFNERRYHQKALFYKLPFRPLLKWCYMMFIRRAFLDGKAGIAYAFLQSFYEYMIVLKTRELEKQSQALGEP